MSSKTLWTELNNSPPPGWFATLLPLNDYEFMCIPVRWSYRKNSSGEYSHGIFIYNSIHNKWYKIINYSNNFITSTHSSTTDRKNNIMYIANCISKLYKIDLNAKIIKLLAHPGLLLMKDKIHLIGAKRIYKHLLYDQNVDKYKLICNFKDNGIMASTSSIYLTSTQTAFTTAYNRDNPMDPVSIMEFKDNKWSDLNIQNCDLLYQSCILSTLNQDYLLFIGGTTDIEFKIHDNIFVYHIKNKKLMKSDIKIPYKGCPVGAITTNDDRDELLTFGFVRNCYKIFSLSDNVQPLPFYLIKFIQKWVCYENLHLIFVSKKLHGYKPTTHWMIGVDIIINTALMKEERLEKLRKMRKLERKRKLAGRIRKLGVK